MNKVMPPPFVVLSFIFLFLSLADVGTTLFAINHLGAVELNTFVNYFLQAGDLAFITIKLMGVIFIIGMLGFLVDRTGVRSIYIMSFACLFTFFVVLSNSLQIYISLT